MTESSFSWKARLKSIQYAHAGIRSFLKTEHNARLHLFSTLLWLAAALVLPLKPAEWLVLILATGMVWITEILNTCLEKILDFISPQWHAAVRDIKDMAAAAVLVASFIALTIGCIIFTPKIYYYVQHWL